jgi:hypothetical protein
MTHEEVNDLMARMLTCATFLTSIEISEILTDEQMEAIIDARSLLIAAATLLEKLNPPPDLGPVMEILKPIPAMPKSTPEVFIDPGVPAIRSHPVSKNACPGCDSRTNKIVHRVDNWLELECPVCGTRWKYTNKLQPKGTWT